MSSRFGCLLLKYWVLWSWLPLCFCAGEEKLTRQNDPGSSNHTVAISDLVSRKLRNQSGSEPRVLTQYDAYPVSAWPPLPTPNDKAFDVPIFGSGPGAAPLVVYSQPGVQTPQGGLQLRPHYSSIGDLVKIDYNQPAAVNAQPYGPLYQPAYPVPNYPSLQSPSSAGTRPPLTRLSASSTPPSELSTVTQPFLVFTFSSTSRRVPQSTASSRSTPGLRIFTAASAAQSETTSRRNTPKQIIHVFTTPSGLAWRRAGFFINPFRTTTPPSLTTPPSATGTALSVGSSVPTNQTSNRTTFGTVSPSVLNDTTHSSISTPVTVKTDRPALTVAVTQSENGPSFSIPPIVLVTETASSTRAFTVSTDSAPPPSSPVTESVPPPSISSSTPALALLSSSTRRDTSSIPSTLAGGAFASSPVPSPSRSIRIIPRVSKRPNVFQLVKRPQSPAPNRIKGKPHILCMASGIMFIAESYFAFDGVIYARGRENRTNCSYASDKNTGELRDRSINVSFPYTDCGEPIIAKKGDHMFQTDVVVSFRDGRIQTFLARCVSQKLRYDVDDLPRKIEEALEELKITPVKVESQAPMPACTMRVVQETEQQKHRYGPSNGSAINDAVIGQQLRMEFALKPPSAAFGFLIRNCTVLDSTIDVRYVIIDDKGCSVDINIFAHPHYDTYHDLAIVHWHAFKVPDSAALSFQCDCVVCTEVADDETGQTSCEQIPTPPICPDVVTSSTLQNALIFDSSRNQVKKKKRREATDQNVRVGFCLSAGQSPSNCSVDSTGAVNGDEVALTDETEEPMCLSKWIFAVSLGFNTSLLFTALSVFCICLRRKRNEDAVTRRKPPLGFQTPIDGARHTAKVKSVS